MNSNNRIDTRSAAASSLSCLVTSRSAQKESSMRTNLAVGLFGASHTPMATVAVIALALAVGCGSEDDAPDAGGSAASDGGSSGDGPRQNSIECHDTDSAPGFPQSCQSSRMVRRGDGPIHELPQGAPMELPTTFAGAGGVELNVDDFLERRTSTKGLLVIKDGEIVFEKYYAGETATSYFVSHSVAKSITSLLVGIALDEGYIEDIDEPVEDYVSGLRGTGYDGVTIKDLLQMNSGIEYSEVYGVRGSDVSRLANPFWACTSVEEVIGTFSREFEPGTHHQYASIDTEVLGLVLREAIKRGGYTSTSCFMEDRVWRHLGVQSDSFWAIDGVGVENSFGGFYGVLRDYARFGLLYLNGGTLNGERIVSESWVDASVARSGPAGYGFQWWLRTGKRYSAIGINGQFVFVDPTNNIVIAKTSDQADYAQDPQETSHFALFDAIVEKLVSAN